MKSVDREVSDMEDAQIEPVESKSIEKPERKRHTLFSAAHKAFRSAVETASAAPGAIGDAIEASPLPDAVSALGRTAGNVAETVGSAAKGVADVAGDTASIVADAAIGVAASAADAAHGALSMVADKAGDVAQAIKENTREAEVKRAKMTAFKDGMLQSEFLIAQRQYDLYCALVALSWYAIRCDGPANPEEQKLLEADLDHLRMREDVPVRVWDELTAIAQKDPLLFSDVSAYLDKVGVDKLVQLQKGMDEIVLADDEISVEEDALLKEYSDYVARRQNSNGTCNG